MSSAFKCYTVDALQCGKESSFTEFYEVIVRRLTLPPKHVRSSIDCCGTWVPGKDAAIPVHVMGSIVPL